MATNTAFSELYAVVQPRLIGALALHSGDRGVAEELAQEALLRTWERWRHVRQLDDPAAWTYRVAFNLSASRFRRRAAERRAQQRMESAALAAPQVGPDHAQAIAVRQAVGSLTTRRRTALVMRYYLDMSVEATAAAMRCSPGTVKALTAQAVATLRQHPFLAEREGTPHG